MSHLEKITFTALFVKQSNNFVIFLLYKRGAESGMKLTLSKMSIKQSSDSINFFRSDYSIVQLYFAKKHIIYALLSLRLPKGALLGSRMASEATEAVFQPPIVPNAMRSK